MQSELLLLTHKNLRTMLVETALQLLHTPLENAVSADALVRQMTKCLELCALTIEEAGQHLLPMAAPYEPSLVDTIQQHIRRMGSAQVHYRLANFAAAHTVSERRVAGPKLAAAFESLVFNQMQLMRLLQQSLLPVLEYYYQPVHLQELLEQMMRAQALATQKTAATEEASFRRQLCAAEQELANTFGPARIKFPATLAF